MLFERRQILFTLGPLEILELYRSCARMRVC
jgi:hypothetical protein